MNQSHKRAALIAALMLAPLAGVSGCAASVSSDTPARSAAIDGINLSTDCPSTIVVQTDWAPAAEHGHLFELLGPDPVIDSSKKSISGALYASGKPTGVNIEIRAGGPAIGYQTVSSQMYSDPSITLGYVSTDEAIQDSDLLPTLAVFAPLEKSPLMIMWDPETYPDVETIADLGQTDAPVLYTDGLTYMDYLTGSGLLKSSQADGSYDGTPANFVAADGKAAQQGYSTSEKYVYANELPVWNKPLAGQLVADAGYPIYQNAISARAADLDSLSSCLAKLVPVMQQAEVDYYANPAATNALIVGAVEEYDTGITESRFDPNDTLANVSTEVGQSMLAMFQNGDDSPTIGEILDQLSTSIGGIRVTGTPESVADEIQHIVDYTDLDGFMIEWTYGHIETYRDFIDQVMPILRDRGVIPHTPRSGSMRERLMGSDSARLSRTHPAAIERAAAV